MILYLKHFVVFVTIIGFVSCGRESRVLSKIEGKQLPIVKTLSPVDSIVDYVAPYRKRVNQVLDSTLAYSPYTITKQDGIYNTSAGNLMADIVLSEANPIFNSKMQNNIDFVVLNHGGIRSVISMGKVSARTAYDVMPFDNNIVVVELNGKSVRDLVAFLVTSRRPHPIAGLQIVLNNNDKLENVNIQGKPFNENQTYFVATSDYLVDGGDNMGFFSENLSLTDTDYRIRNAMIDYFKKVDTLTPKVDNRFIKLK